MEFCPACSSVLHLGWLSSRGPPRSFHCAWPSARLTSPAIASWRPCAEPSRIRAWSPRPGDRDTERGHLHFCWTRPVAFWKRCPHSRSPDTLCPLPQALAGPIIWSDFARLTRGPARVCWGCRNNHRQSSLNNSKVTSTQVAPV